jgi:phytoene/squalene synthetase
MTKTNSKPTKSLAAAITQAASKQTYYTILFLVDRQRVEAAYQAYAYFRWVDDTLDEETMEAIERMAFFQRQKDLLENCYQSRYPESVNQQENMLIELVQQDKEPESGLKSYLYNMMAVMDIDATRRGRSVSQVELNEYTRYLATAVTEAMHYFVGHCCYSPNDETRYLAVTAAHITHMLRDTYDDLQAGYFNIPSEVLVANHLSPHDVQHPVYRAWVRNRVQLARYYFEMGKQYLRQVENLRCRLAGFAYTARFEWLLDTIEKENYSLRPEYPERKRLKAGLKMLWQALCSMFMPGEVVFSPQTVTAHQRTIREP